VCSPIARGIDPNLCAEWLHPTRKFGVAITHGWRQKCPARATGVFREGRQLLAPGNDFFRAICDFNFGLHWIPIFAEEVVSSER
jgi:hypothetical protein